jgi:hypothetical protein
MKRKGSNESRFTLSNRSPIALALWRLQGPAHSALVSLDLTLSLSIMIRLHFDGLLSGLPHEGDSDSPFHGNVRRACKRDLKRIRTRPRALQSMKGLPRLVQHAAEI